MTSTRIKRGIGAIAWMIILCGAIFITLAAVWICKTYGVLLIAMADESFRNMLQNKRTLFAKHVVLPTAAIFVILLMFYPVWKKLNRRCMTCISVILLLISVYGAWEGLDGGSYLARVNRLRQEQWFDADSMVMHALGAVDGMTYTNSREALELSYHNGERVMECDFAMTSDKQIVACHDWKNWNRKTNPDEEAGESYIPTLAFFMQCRLMGKYTPLSGDDIVLFMKEHPDLYIITDTKDAEPEKIVDGFTALVEAAVRNECEETLDRMVVQIYHGYMYDLVNDIYPFPNYIYTLYQEGFKGEPDKMRQYAQYCVLHNIDVITMRASCYHEELGEICTQYGVRIFVHTVNDKNEIASFTEKGIGVYTDGL